MKVNIPAASVILFGFILSCTSKQNKDIDNNQLLGSGFGINGVTLVVKSLDSARNYYATVLGFAMPKAENFEPGLYRGTLSTLVNFPDQSYLELLAVNDTGKVAVKDSFITSLRKNNQGARLYSISTSSTDTTFRWLKSKELATDSIMSGRTAKKKPKGWSFDDGGAQWRSVEFDTINPPPYLPNFTEYVGYPYTDLKEDWSPAGWRKYYDSNPNGVVGITSLLIVVEALEPARKKFKKIGFRELEASDTLARFKVAHKQELQLTAPKSSGDAYSRFLKKRGPGVYAMRFEVKNLKDTRDFLKKKLPAKAMLADMANKRLTVFKEHAYGVQLDFIQESKEQAALAKIYDFKEDTKLNSASLNHASRIYAKYCALCHGKDREGYTADNAPSLRSHALMATTLKPKSSYNYLEHTISYGRPGTAMAPYGKSQGGPLSYDEIELLLKWLHEKSGVKKPIEMSANPVSGNVVLGKGLYVKHCASCHGAEGEGLNAPALGNPMLLATASDEFLRYTITEGRNNTPMPAFKDNLSKVEINALTAFLRSRASGWNAPEAVTIKEPLPKDYVLNPTRKAPKFALRENLYVSAVQVRKALQENARIVILDARSKAAWHQTHIPGAVPVPYYEEPDKFIKDIPNDSTMIVVYCACPHAASSKVVNTLRRFGYKHTAILDEGILVWAQRGYPVEFGQDSKKKK
ncbi:c-type cytochrome [Dyadobacter psychrotolerans]|uniref:C-type cytochrome n=1 Tax=Dyadobacter psychrotolerans TaxID=2541721 RepID=A0A4R5DSK0_9BACT|nr:c-type cytochrome [Dyadobacter psychrotolerans]TDE17329.1 c-type cytochrome [Dyadobacter psychrotolerans]